MFDWLRDLITSLADAITNGFMSAAREVSNAIWNAMIKWLYNSVYSAVADFFTMMGNMGAEIFELAWIKAIITLFTLFGWGLFATGAVVAIFDFAIEYQSGRGNIRNTLLNILKGAFACSLVGVVPVELYKFSISLQNTFAGELARIFSWQSGIDFSSRATIVLGNTFAPLKAAGNLLLNFLTVPDFIAYKFEDRSSYCLRSCVRVWGAQEVDWTIRTKEDLLACEAAGGIPIFERFDPEV